MTTLREALSDAFEQHENTPAETPITPETPAEPTEPAPVEGRVRDESGRFAKADKPADPAPQKTDPQPPQPLDPQPVAAAPRKAPSSWAKDYWDRWEKLDPQVQEYIEKRESDYAKGVSTYKSQWDSAQPILKAMEQFTPELQHYGIAPDQWITNLGQAHRMLSLGSPEQKMQMFAKLANDYGINLGALQEGGQFDPQYGQLTQTVSSLQAQIQQFQRAQAAAEQQRMQQEIEAFKKEAPHFDQVRETMSQLLEAKAATTLKDAYEKAVRLNDELWQQSQAAQQAKAEADRVAELAKKKAAAVSPKSSSPTGAMVAGNGKKSLREQLSEAIDAHSAGRF